MEYLWLKVKYLLKLSVILKSPSSEMNSALTSREEKMVKLLKYTRYDVIQLLSLVFYTLASYSISRVFGQFYRLFFA